jgi:hypothetical protein
MSTPDFVVYFDVFALAVHLGDQLFADKSVRNFGGLRG